MGFELTSLAFIVATNTYPQTIAVIETRAKHLGIEIEIKSCNDFEPEANIFGVLLQYPNQYGEIHEYRKLVNLAHENGIAVAVAGRYPG